MEQLGMHLLVCMPSAPDGMHVPVQPTGTPGHLKENIKYSLGVPPKHIRIEFDGKTLDDITTFEAQGVVDGSKVVARIDETCEVKPETQASAPKPTVIKKEEPKPKKPRKETVRPTLSEKDVVKQSVLCKGAAWTRSGAQLAFLSVEAKGEEREDITVCMDDAQMSPAWTAVCEQLGVGEKAVFAINDRVLDFDPENLGLVGSSRGPYTVELVKLAHVHDEGESGLLLLEDPGNGDTPACLDQVMVHWRMRRWSGVCIASSRERMAILPGHGIVQIEDPNAPAVGLSVGEGQQEAIELVASRLKPGGRGSLYLKSKQLQANRPAGPVVLDVELVQVHSGRPGTSTWKGWVSLTSELRMGDEWLDRAERQREQVETFDQMRKATTADEKEAVTQIMSGLSQAATNAQRRYRRFKEWLAAAAPADTPDKKRAAHERLRADLHLAKALALERLRFGDEALKLGDEATKALAEAEELLKGVLAANDAELETDARRGLLQLYTMLLRVPEARVVLDELLKTHPDMIELKDAKARIHRLETALNLKKGGSQVEEVQKDLQVANEAKDMAAVTAALEALGEIFAQDGVKYDVLRTLKVGKDVGNAMKLGDPEVTKQARVIVGGIQRLAQKQDAGL